MRRCNILAIVLLSSSCVQLLKVRAYKQQDFTTDQNGVANRLRLHVSAYAQDVMITGQQLKKKRRPSQIMKPVTVKPIEKPVSSSTKPVATMKPTPSGGGGDNTSTTKPAPSPVQIIKPVSVKPIQQPVSPSTKPVATMKPTPFSGGGTQFDWYCGNRTANTCSSQKCSDPIIGCPGNDYNRDCMNECIPVTSAKPMKSSAKPMTLTSVISSPSPPLQ